MSNTSIRLVKGRLGTFTQHEDVILLVTPALGHAGDEMVLSTRDWRLDAAELISREKDPAAVISGLLMSITPVKDAPVAVHMFKQVPVEQGQPIKWAYHSLMGSLWRSNPEDKEHPTKHTADEFHALLMADEPKVGDFWPAPLSGSAGINDVRFQRGEW